MSRRRLSDRTLVAADPDVRRKRCLTSSTTRISITISPVPSRAKDDLDIVRVQDVGLTGAAEETVLAWAADHNRVLLTHDVFDDYGPRLSTGHEGDAMPGVFETSRYITGTVLPSRTFSCSRNATLPVNGRVRSGMYRRGSAGAGPRQDGRLYTEHDPDSEREMPTSAPAHNTSPTRRDLLRLAGAITAGTAYAQNRGNAVEPQPPQIGILIATTFTTGTLEARLDAAKACGFACVQMSMACANLPELPDQIPAELPARIRREASARGIAIASVTGTFNMTHPDPEHRRSGLRRLRVLAGACAPMGTSKIHVCTGTRDTNSMWRYHPDNGKPDSWRDMVASMREATDIARQANVILAFEPEMSNVVDSAQKARRLLDEIGSPHLKVTMDPANLFHAGELPRMPEILDEAFALLGKDVVLCHAKDLDHDGEAGHKPAGHGVLDYGRYMRLLRRYDFKGQILLHGLTVDQVPGCLAYVRSKLASAYGARA